MIIKFAKRSFRFLSSLKTAIPLLVITILVTIGGSLFPTPDMFRSWWYLSLLGLNGISLLFITILHIPMILERKGRNALIGVVVTHAGILILIAGIIYGGTTGFRYEVKVIEDEVSIVPGLPFNIHLEKLVVEDYPEGTFPEGSTQASLRMTQDSHLALLKNGQKFASFVVRPGAPARIDGITILPSLNDVGMYIELISTDRMSRETTIGVKPWAPPIFTLGDTPIMIHNRQEGNTLTAEVFTMVDEQVQPLGIVSSNQELELERHTLKMGNIKQYTSLTIYNRPHEPILIAGCLAMLFGLVWHFYFRHRDRRQTKRKMDAGSSPA